MLNYFWITIFGILGVLARYQTGLVVDLYNNTAFPWTTLTVNLVGSFLMGLMYVVLTESRFFAPHISLAIMIGFLGGFTTFSSLTLDVLKLIHASHLRMMIIYVSVSIFGGIFLVWAGWELGKFLFKN